MAALYFILIKLTAMFFSFSGTGLAAYVLKKSEMLDHPNARSNHHVPIPRGAGIAVTLVLATFLLVSGAPGSLAFALLFLGAVSFIDDKRGVSPDWRLLAQLFAVIWTFTLVEGLVFQGLLPPLLDRIVMVIVWLWMINLTNFMDGIDGITGGHMLVMGGGIALFGWVAPNMPHGVIVDGALLAAVCAGFLWWNWHPAKVFLGDVGSIPLGFFAGYLLCTIAAYGYWQAALILPAYYLTDATVTLFRRLSRGEKLWEAHSKHFYQQAVRGGRSHDEVAGLVMILAMLLAVLACATTLGQEVGWVCLAVSYALTFGLMGVFAAHGARPSRTLPAM